MPTAPDSLRKKIQQLQTKLTAIEAQQSAARTAALTFLRDAIADLGLTPADVAGAVKGGSARRGRPAKSSKTPARVAAKGPRKGAKRKGTRGTASTGAGKRPSKGAAGVKVPAKYRGPAGESWSGRGKQPRWLSALVAQGHTPTEFLIAK